MRPVREATAPRRVWVTTMSRARASPASASSHERSRANASGGNLPSSPSGVSGTVKIGAVGSPCSRSMEARCGRISSTASGATRSRTIATAVPRSAAVRRRSQGTASAYRAAVVTNSQRSAADSSWVASSRLAETTESMSGASSRAIPAGRASEPASRTVPGWSSPVSRPVTRARPGRMRSSSNQCRSPGWCTSTGEVVVGLRTPGRLTRSPTTELTSVDLPAPVEPPTTASRGASRERSRGST